MLEDSAILCGIKLRKDMDNITPAANANILKINDLDGYFIIPSIAPRIGPIIEIINKSITLFILSYFRKYLDFT